MSDQIIQETVDRFHRDGVVVLRGAFVDWIDRLRDGVEMNIKTPGPDAREYRGDYGRGRFFGDYCNWSRIDPFKDFIHQSDAARMGAQLMGSRTVQLFHEHVLIKEADAAVPTPRHQDAPYYSVACDQTVSFWIPLDPVDRETTLEFVAGSHAWGKSFRPDRFNGDPLNENDDQESIPDIDADRSAFDILGWAMEPGDAVAFDYRTVHGSRGNRHASRQRRAFSLRLLGDGARFVRRDGVVTSPPFPGVTLADQAPLTGAEFPMLLTG